MKITTRFVGRPGRCWLAGSSRPAAGQAAGQLKNVMNIAKLVEKSINCWLACCPACSSQPAGGRAACEPAVGRPAATMPAGN